MSGLPSSWVIATLGEITQHRVAQPGPKGDGTFTYVDISSIDNQKKEIIDPKILPVSEAPSRAKQGILEDDVLVSMTRPNLNAVARVPKELSGAIASTGFHVLRAVEVEPKWISLRVRSKEFVSEMSDLVQGALYPAVRPFDIQSHNLPIPPILEQRRIVAKIESLMARSRKAGEALSQIPGFLELYRQSVLSAALRGDLTKQWRSQQHGEDLNARNQLRSIQQDRQKRWHRRGGLPVLPSLDSSNLTSLPEDWVWSRVEEVGEVRLGRQRAPQHHQGPNMRSYLRVQNVFEDRLDLSDVMTMNFDPEEAITFNLVPGDLLLNEGQSLELVGRPAMYRGELPGVCFTNTLIRFRAYQGVLPEYALLVFRTYLRTGRFQEIASWSTNIAHLGADRFAKMEFPLPALAEQVEIVRKAKSLLEAADRIGAFSAEGMKAFITLDQAILGKAFCGELVAQDPNDEPAEILLARIRAEREANPASTRRSHGVPIATRPQPPSRAARPATAKEPPLVPRAAANRPKADGLDADTGLPAFRQALTAQARWNSDDDLLRAVAQRLGYERLGSSVKEALRGHLRAALLRRIVERQEDGTPVVGPRTLDAYTRDELIDAIPSVMRKGQAIDRDELMRAILHHFAFQRLTDPAHDALKSALNSAIRRGVLEASGPGRVRRLV